MRKKTRNVKVNDLELGRFFVAEAAMFVFAFGRGCEMLPGGGLQVDARTICRIVGAGAADFTRAFYDVRANHCSATGSPGVATCVLHVAGTVWP